MTSAHRPVSDPVVTGIGADQEWPPLSDGTVILRPFTLANIEGHLAGEDDELRRWLGGGASTADSVRRWISDAQWQWRHGGPALTFAICRGEDVVGLIEATIGAAHMAGWARATRMSRTGCIPMIAARATFSELCASWRASWRIVDRRSTIRNSLFAPLQATRLDIGLPDSDDDDIARVRDVEAERKQLASSWEDCDRSVNGQGVDRNAAAIEVAAACVGAGVCVNARQSRKKLVVKASSAMCLLQ